MGVNERLMNPGLLAKLNSSNTLQNALRCDFEEREQEKLPLTMQKIVIKSLCQVCLFA